MSTSPADDHDSLIINYFVAKFCEISPGVAVSCLYWHFSFLHDLYYVTVQADLFCGQGSSKIAMLLCRRILNYKENSVMPYPEILIQPMREDLTRLGVEELRTAEQVDDTIRNSEGTLMVVVNSICGCAAGMCDI